MKYDLGCLCKPPSLRADIYMQQHETQQTQCKHNEEVFLINKLDKLRNVNIERTKITFTDNILHLFSCNTHYYNTIFKIRLKN